VLRAIYEEEFLQFSCGFRYDALDALMVGILGTKVNFILDADIRSVFNEVSRSSSRPPSEDWLPPSKSTVSFLQRTTGRGKGSGISLVAAGIVLSWQRFAT
jgi:hypothetical protein